MPKLRFALLGAGFWARFQLAGWLETGLVECVAICDPIEGKAQALAQSFGVASVYTDASLLLEQESLDFVDICTSVETHVGLAMQCADKGLNIVCQKPLATSLTDAEALVAYCDARSVRLLVNENWRWQSPIRQLRDSLATGRIGQVFRARIDYRNSFPVFDNQPFLKTLDQFILTDIGPHILDVARFLFGEAESLYCQIHRVHQDIRGEDVASVMMKMASGPIVVCDMSYASPREHDRFPETYAEIEGDAGFLELGPDYWLRETLPQGTLAKRYPPPRFDWADPAYDLIHASIVACQTHLARVLLGEETAETDGADNLQTMRLVYGSYDSAASGQAIRM